MARWLIALAATMAAFGASVEDVSAQSYTSLQWGINQGQTPSPVCVMKGGACLGTIGSLNVNNGTWTPAGGAGTGSVTSVGLSLPLFTVTGSPVTTSGTIVGTLAAQNATTFLAGPTSGASQPPTFRAISALDLPGCTVGIGSTVPNPPGGLTQFLRGDCSWAVPAGGGGGGSISFPQIVAGTTTSGGITYFFNATTLASSGVGTSGAPILWGGSGSAPISTATISGNSQKFVTTTGTLTSGDCVKIDANGNFVDNGAACAGGGGITVGTTAVGGVCTTGNVLYNNGGVVGCEPSGGSASVTVGSSTITSGTNGRVLYDNSGVLGEIATTGTGSVVLGTAPTITLANATALPLTTGVTGVLPGANGGSTQFVGAIGGTSTALTLATPIPNNFTLTANYTVCGYSSVQNGVSPTLQVAATTATAIRSRSTNGLAALVGGEIASGQLACFFYDGTYFELMSRVPGNVEEESGSYSAGALDGNGDYYIFTGASSTLTLPISTTVPSTWTITAFAQGGPVTISLNSSSDYINGVINATILVPTGSSATITTDGATHYYIPVTGGVTSGTTNYLAYYPATGQTVAGERYLAAAQMPALSGDVTNSAGSLTTTVGAIGGKAVSLGGALTLSGGYPFTGTLTGSTGVTFPTSGTLATMANLATALPSATTAQVYGGSGAAGAALLLSTTGTGSVVLSTNPVLTTPNLGTPSAATLTNATGLPLTTGVAGTLAIANGGTGTTSPSLVAGSNITISGSWPNQTVAATGGGGGLANVYDISNPTYGCTASSSTSSSDQAPCIQSAINAASTAGGGLVWAPAGFWNLKSQLTVKPNVTLQCASNGAVYSAAYLAYGNTSAGTILSVLWGSGSQTSTTTAIRMDTSSKVINCGFWYPNQLASASSPTVYGSTLLLYGTSGSANFNQEIVGNYFANSYVPIDARGTIVGWGVGRIKIHDNTGAGIYANIMLNDLIDWAAIHDNNWNSGELWGADPSPASHLMGWVATYGKGYITQCSGWVEYIGEQLFGYNVGFYFDWATSCPGFADAGPVILSHVGVDGSSIGVGFTGTTQAVTIENSVFTAFNPYTNAQGQVLGLGAGASITSLNMNNNYAFGPLSIFINGVGTITNSIITGNTISSIGTGLGNCIYIASGTQAFVTQNICTGGFSAVLSATGVTNVYAPAGANAL